MSVLIQLNPIASNVPDSSLNDMIDCIDKCLIGKWCLVAYERKPFPGIIQNVDQDECEVKVKNKIVDNRFFCLIWKTFCGTIKKTSYD